MTSFGFIRILVCVHVVFLLGVAGRSFATSRSPCLPRLVASGPPTTTPTFTYPQVDVAGYARDFPTQSEPQLPTATNIIIDTNSLDASRPVATALARDPTSGVTKPEEDTGSKIQAIFFGIAGTCIGVASLAVALLSLRAMSRQRQIDPEMPLSREGGRSDSGGMELAQHPSSTASEQTPELSTVQAADDPDDMQHERPAASATVLN